MRCRRRCALAFAAGAASCASLNGYDPDRYVAAPPAASVDPETAPIGHPAKRWIRDPRSPVDAGPEDDDPAR